MSSLHSCDPTCQNSVRNMLRFRGLAKSSGGRSGGILSSITGYQVVRDGDDWVVPDDDPQLKKGPPPVLAAADKPTTLSKAKYDDIAATFVNHNLNLNKEFEEFRKSHPITPNPVPLEYGVLSDFWRIRDAFFFSDTKRLHAVIRDDVLPFMHSTLRAKSVWPVHVDARYQQSVLSLAKISHLVSLHGIQESQRLIFEQRAMGSILPSPLDVLTYPNGLLTFSPCSAAIPVSRLGADLYFLRDGLWKPPTVALQGLYGKAILGNRPIADSRRHLPLVVRSADVPRYFKLAIESVNLMMRFLNDPLSFRTDNDEVDNESVLMTHASVGFLFADLISLSHTESEYIRQRLAFSFLDKMANLKARWSASGKGDDVAIFKRLLSLEFGELVAHICGTGAANVHRDLAKTIRDAALTVYRSVHEHVLKSLGKQADEDEIIEHLRTLRNCTHGAFLKGDKFQKSFFASDATIPPDVSNLPLFLTWAFTLNAKQVLEY